MKRSILILLLSFVLLNLYSEDITFVSRSHTDDLKVNLGKLYIQDDYLSTLRYDGYLFGLSNEWTQLLLRDSTKQWWHRGIVGVSVGKFYNTVKSNSIIGVSGRAAWGSFYNFDTQIKVDGLGFNIGPFIALDVFAKYHNSNVNKPLSIDFASDIEAYANIYYSFAAPRSSYRLGYEFYFGLFGVMFAPEYAESYYEISKGELKNTIAFSSLHNKINFLQRLYFEIQFKHSCWTIGIEHKLVRYNHNILYFSQDYISLNLGTKFNYQTFIKKFK